MHRRVLRRIATVVAAVAMVACTRRGADVGGLELEIVNDGSLEIDVIHVDISTAGERGKVLLSRDYRIPGEATLPNTIAIASNGDATATVTISVSAYRLEAGARVPIDRRDHLVTQIPTDRVVALPVVLSAACQSHVKATGGTSDALSDCAAGTTCAPATGQCTSSTINASMELKPYSPGDEAAASGDAGRARACTPGSNRCSDHSTLQTCSGSGDWNPPSPCIDQACVSGSCEGVCAPAKTQCNGNGVQTCSEAGVWGAAQACNLSTCVAGTCEGSCLAGSKQCSGNDVQTCSATGTWAGAVPCAHQVCVAGACQGSCAPGETRCADNGVQTCSASGTWGATSACSLGMACLGALPTAACGSISDDFDDNSFDLRKWIVNPNDAQFLSETTQQLILSVPAGSSGKGLLSAKCSLSGDFDIQIDYSIAGWTGGDLHLGIATNDFSIERDSQNGFGESYVIGFTMAGSTYIYKTAATENSGKLRMTRSGVSFSGYYYRGGTWTLVGSGDEAATPISFRVGSWVATNTAGLSTSTASLDNFKVISGAVVCP